MKILSWAGSVLFEDQSSTVAETLVAAIVGDADLRHANLSDANLSDANLSRANLRHANLRHADLSRANLRHANLRHADLSRANLRHADLSRADLSRANLRHADLRHADLSRADLSDEKNDLFEVLSHAPAEVPALLAALKDGRVDGSCYEGSCACLVGTLANARGCNYRSIEGLLPDSRRPAEKWFLRLRPGITPETDQVAAITVGWIEEWLSKQKPNTVV